ncbi:hypothetical protein V501_04388 [Pseudogymnoascus sp. VKM F-4519 (FW-2642)]|nr:hypothetical protein V501_04388 [Pseudogymnoascus sp. VKM F-4519 (FW-2642)]
MSRGEETREESGGKFIEGYSGGNTIEPIPQSIMVLDAKRVFYGFIITQIWAISGTAAFVLDTGYSCTTPFTPPRHLPANVIPTCYTPTNRVYYLVAAIGDAQDCSCESNCGSGGKGCLENDFKVPPGVTTLDGIRWGGVTKEDIIIGSVATFVANGNKNGGGRPRYWI